MYVSLKLFPAWTRLQIAEVNGFNFMCCKVLLAIYFILSIGGVSIFAQGTAEANQQAQNVAIDETQMVLQEEATPAVTQQNVRMDSSIGTTLRAFFVLALVLALSYFFLRFLRRFSGQETYESSTIKIIASQSLRGQASVQIIEVANRIFVLGVGENVSLIAEVAEKEALDELRLQASQQIPKQSFAQLLRGKLTIQGADPKIKTILNTEQQTDRIRQLLVKKNTLEREESDSSE